MASSKLHASTVTLESHLEMHTYHHICLSIKGDYFVVTANYVAIIAPLTSYAGLIGWTDFPWKVT